MGKVEDENKRYIESKQLEIQMDAVRLSVERGNNTSEETNLLFMEAMAEQYEMQQEQNLITSEVLATIYEAILERGDA